MDEEIKETAEQEPTKTDSTESNGVIENPTENDPHAESEESI